MRNIIDNNSYDLFKVSNVKKNMIKIHIFQLFILMVEF